MKLKLYNTLTRQKEDFVPRKEGKVKIYSCWPTVYRDPHIGNLRAFTFAGLLWDICRAIGYTVEHTMNVTDVGHLTDDWDQGEDKMEKWAKREWITVRDIAKKYENNFRKDLKDLRIHFDHIPRATDHIPEQIAIVQSLIEQWYTYEIAGDGVYMDTSRIADYGKLLPPEHLAWLQKWARVDATGKKNTTDFALWKYSPTDEQRQMERIFQWNRSGILITQELRDTITDQEQATRGFPWRHIECSAMARATLGDFIDIHTGGVDHVPVHHTNEICQSECWFTHGEKRVNYRLHCQFLNMDTEKISKSLGNVKTVSQLQEEWYDPLDLRYFYMLAHYRSFQDFTKSSLDAAKNARKNLKKKLQKICNIQTPTIEEFDDTTSAQELKGLFTDAFIANLFDDLLQNLCDDINLPETIATMQHAINTITEQKLAVDTRELYVLIHRLDTRILKLDILEQEEIEIPAQIQSLAQQRRDAKLSKDYAKADALRNKLHIAGREMLDEKNNFKLQKL